MESELIQVPTQHCHASTIEETAEGLIAAWFGGSGEGQHDACIYVSRKHKTGDWSQPELVASGIQETGEAGARLSYACWNPVLYRWPRGPLVLWFKVGPTPRDWWGEELRSSDGGATWSHRRPLPHDCLGPIRNRPLAISDDLLLCGSSTEKIVERSGGQPVTLEWRCHMELTDVSGDLWHRLKDIEQPPGMAAIQPTFLQYHDGNIEALCRTRRHGIASSMSHDGGKTWSPLTAIDMPCPNSGIAALTLKDGRHLLVSHSLAKRRSGGSRFPLSPLDLSIREPGGKWRLAMRLESDHNDYSYPAILQAADDSIHLTWTWKWQAIKHVSLLPSELN